MLQKDKELETLMNLGLTYLQAKSYLALTQLEKAGAKQISKVANVARQDIYRIMPTLEKLGLAEKIVATPIVYKATPLKDGFLMLFQKRTVEHSMLREKVKSLLNSDKEKNVDATIREEATQFIITSEKKLLAKKFQASFLEARTCEVIIPETSLSVFMFLFFEFIKVALAKGAKIRMITEETKISSSLSRKLETLKKNPFFEIRFVSTPIIFKITVFNGSEVNMCISNTSDLPSLWTDNPQFLNAVQTIFENEWNNARDNLDEKLKILDSPQASLSQERLKIGQ